MEGLLIATTPTEGSLQKGMPMSLPVPMDFINFQIQEQPFEIIQEFNHQLNTNCQGKSCCPVEPNESMQFYPPADHCSCETVPCTTTSSEHSSSFNSCMLPLKPLKGILKKSSQNQSVTNQAVVLLSSSSLTQLSPQDILCHGQQRQLKHQLQHQFEVVPFDQVPPCDDCMQHAQQWGSFGDVCQNLEVDMSCGFQRSALQRAGTISPAHSSTSQNSAQIPGSASVALRNPPGAPRLCCKHDQTRLKTVKKPLTCYAGSTLLITSRQSSFDEKEEVEAVESSV